MSEETGAIGPAAERIRRLAAGPDPAAACCGPVSGSAPSATSRPELGVSRSTVRQALAALEAAGEVRRVPGRGGGTFVRGRKVERDLSQVVGVPALLRAQGMTSGSRIVSTGMVVADEETAAALALAQDAYVVDVVRIRLADGTPISLEHVRLPAERFPRLLDLPLGGRSTTCSRSTTTPSRGRPRSTSRSRRPAPTRRRSSPPNQALRCSRSRRTTCDTDGVPFEYSHDLFRADRTTITVRTPATARSRRESAQVVSLQTWAR